MRSEEVHVEDGEGDGDRSLTPRAHTRTGPGCHEASCFAHPEREGGRGRDMTERGRGVET